SCPHLLEWSCGRRDGQPAMRRGLVEARAKRLELSFELGDAVVRGPVPACQSEYLRELRDLALEADRDRAHPALQAPPARDELIAHGRLPVHGRERARQVRM